MTKVIVNLSELEKTLSSKKNIINFVPTMGSFHSGHGSLVKEAKRREGKTLVSIFVNPLQFSEIKDYENYPENISRDIKFLENLKVDYIFIPKKEEFLVDITCKVYLGDISNLLCGIDRRYHFEGVALIIMKFLIIINPDFILLGQKDFQQILVIKKIIDDFSFKTKIISLKTFREKSGLALSSRNIRLSNEQMEIAPLLFISMKKIKKKILQSELKFNSLEEIKVNLIKDGFEKINYLEIRKEKDLKIIDGIPDFSRIFISALLGKVRLIDNIRIGKVKLMDGYVLKS